VEVAPIAIGLLWLTLSISEPASRPTSAGGADLVAFLVGSASWPWTSPTPAADTHGYATGIVFSGSMNGIGTIVAVRGPHSDSTSSRVPLAARLVGTQA
jgi:hypothetical protein